MRSYFLPSLISLAFLPAVAAAASLNTAPAMPLGAAAPPPLGFTELCQRAPTECVDNVRPGAVDSDAKIAELAEVRQWAGQARWAALFGKTTANLSEAPASAFPGFINRAPANRSSVANILPEGGFDAPKAADVEVDTDASIDARPPIVEAVDAAPMVSQLSARDLQRINSRINRSIHRAEDYETYGRADYWAAGSDNVKRGDCEDYALAKRRALIEEGTPGEALSIAIVRTRQGEMHAVLLVATEAGEVVLDNLSPWVLPWNEAPYQWLDRQVPGAPTQWVHVQPMTRS
jgi:predicted transglutaminase-like cysteine proteinase